jgi:hypothetical protein
MVIDTSLWKKPLIKKKIMSFLLGMTPFIRSTTYENCLAANPGWQKDSFGKAVRFKQHLFFGITHRLLLFY